MVTTSEEKTTRKNIVNTNRSSDKEASSSHPGILNPGSLHAADDVKDGSEFVYLFKLKEIAPSLTEPLRSLMLSQPDRMTKREYVAKLVEWWKLLDLLEEKQ